jgi:hypothetical protein
MGLFDTQAKSAFDMAQDHLSGQEAVLEQLQLLVEGQDTNVLQLAITDINADPGLQKDFPTPGSQRWLIHRIATGGNVELKSEAIEDVADFNPNRLGGTIVNWGETVVVLFLALASTAKSQGGIAQVVLEPKGGSWDFRLGNLFWCGSVSAKSLAGAGKVSLAEV